MSLQKYGWIPQLPDWRDRPFSLSTGTPHLPASVDLRPQDSPIYDQGQLGSCTGNAVAGNIQFARRKEGLPDLVPSRLFAYYNARVIEGTTAYDAGASIRDGIKGVVRKGDCAEADWPYDIAQFAAKPPPKAYSDALHDRVIRYSVVHQSQIGIKTCLALGFPFVFGFTVYDSFESDSVAATGIMPMPLATENVLGGHAVMAVGYNDASQYLIVRNSWGVWGDKGYFYMPYSYVLSPNLASDFWMIQLLSAT